MPEELKKALNPAEARRVVLGFLLLAGLSAFLLYPYFRPRPPLFSGTKVPDFELELLSGGEPGDRVRRVDLNQKPLILDFWASWCAPCRAQTESLIRAYPKLAGRATVLGIATGEPREAAAAFLQGHETPYSNAYDEDAGLARALQVSTLPTLLIVDARGQIVAASTRQLSAEAILELLDKAPQSAEK